MFKRKIRRSREFNKNNRWINFEKAGEDRKEKRETLPKKARTYKKKAKPSKWRMNEKYRNRNLFAVVIVVIVTVIGFSVFNIFSVNARLAEAITEQEGLLAEKEKLTYDLENVDNEEYIEQQARDLLKMIKPGEIYYVVPEEEE